MRPVLLALLALFTLWPLSAAPSPAAPPRDEVDRLVAELEKRRDDADPALIEELARLGTRAAAEGLLHVYDAMGSIYMRREVVRALRRLDGVPEAEQLALQKLMDVATTAKERELREAAIDALADCPHLGKDFLRMIIESPADDSVRERAMERHVELAADSDREFYLSLYRPGGEGGDGGVDPRTKRKKKADRDREERERKKRERAGEEADEDAGKELAVHALPRLRELAFGVLLSSLSVDELEEAVGDRNPEIRGRALEELARRDPAKALPHAEEIYEDLEGNVDNRIVAARILAEQRGAKVADEFIDRAKKFVTPMRLRYALADLLVGMNDPKVDKKLARLVGKGKNWEKLFSLRAARELEDPKLDKAIAKLLRDKDPEVRVQAARTLAARGRAEKAVVEELRKVVEKSDDAELVTAAVDALSELLRGDAEWRAQLAAMATSEVTEQRNAAIARLGAEGGDEGRRVLLAALEHPNWSTRLVALRGLEALRDPSVVGAIVERMQLEEGRMLHEFADTLFRLSGQPFRTNKSSWKAWWAREGATFQVISPEELAKRQEEEEERRLKQITNVEFFGIRIESHRVIFIIDVSGSMVEPTRSRYVGETGAPRIDIAKRELEKCIDGLDPKALFNIITFSGGVEPWLDEGVAGSSGKTREEAKEWVRRLGAMGATNLYDALAAAFEDPDVDTIFVLSDGEPTAGAQTDPGIIREHVARWNSHRGIVIHSIAVGGRFKILEWLAEDSGGTHVRFD